MGNPSTATVPGKTHQQRGKQPLPHLCCALGLARPPLPALGRVRWVSCVCELRTDNLSSGCPWCTLCISSTGTLEDTSRTVKPADGAGSQLRWGITAHRAGGRRAPAPAPTTWSTPGRESPSFTAGTACSAWGRRHPWEPGQLPAGDWQPFQEEEEEEGT